MNNLETYQIHEILMQNCLDYDEWSDFLCEQLNCYPENTYQELQQIEDAVTVRDLYDDFFTSSYNAFVDDDGN